MTWRRRSRRGIARHGTRAPGSRTPCSSRSVAEAIQVRDAQYTAARRGHGVAQARMRAWPAGPVQSPDGRRRRQSAPLATLPLGRGQVINRSVVSMRCMTGSGGVTFCWRHGNVCKTQSRRCWHRWHNAGDDRAARRERLLSRKWRHAACREVSAAARCCGDTFRSQTAGSGRWAFRRFETAWCRWRRRSCWSRSSRRTSARASYGFRPKRSATQALEAMRMHGARGGNHVLDADIRDYFGSIDQDC